MDFIKRSQEINDELIKYRRQLHATPEIGIDLPITTAFVVKKLKEFGYEPTEISQSAILATVGGKKPGKVFLIRGDMDGLPTQELTDCQFKSTNGNMHACGHDMHTTMLLGAAKMLKECEDEINGTIKLMFQPGEETLQGAKAMIEAGILENPKVDAAMMIHVMCGFPIPSGKVIIPKSGAFSASADLFDIEILGRGCHGAMPEFGIDPLNVAAHIHTALQTLPSREVAASDPVIVTVGKMSGGTTYNIIPDKAYMKGTIRAFNSSTRDKLGKRVIEVAQGIAKTMGAEVKTDYIRGCPSVFVDKSLVTSVENSISSKMGKNIILDMSKLMPGGKMMGSEDFAFVSMAVPSIMISISAGDPKDGHSYPMHHPKATFDEASLQIGAAAYAIVATGWLNENK